IIWLGLSGMTSDIPSVIMIAAFGLFLLRWLDTNQSVSLLAASGCLFVADGLRYEDWFFSVTFSLLLVYRFISALRAGQLTRQLTALIISALGIANAFPILHMSTSYYLFGNLIPGMEHTDSFRVTAGAPIAKMNIVLLALSASPMEIASAMGGIALFLKSEGRKSARIHLLLVLITFLLFAAAFKGRLPVHGAGPERILLPYVVLLLPYAGFLLTRCFRAYGLSHTGYAVFAALLLLA